MSVSPRRPVVAAVLVALLFGSSLSACGSDSGSTAGAANSGEVIVSAAGSLKTALTNYGGQFDGATVRLSFAGSDELAAQIRQGIKPDVFAAANTKLPEQLFREGLVEKPVRFATNELVLAVPAGSGTISSVEDLTGNGVTIAVGADGVPVGDYTRTVLDRLPEAHAMAILSRIRSREPDVGGIVGKLTQGAVDAGFVYRSDVRATGGKLRAIELPEMLKPTVEYGVAIVKGARNKAGGQAFIDGLLQGSGADALRSNGFGAPAGA